MDQKQLAGKVCELGRTGGGTLEVSANAGTAVLIAQTEWNDTPVCFVGGNGSRVYALEPEDIELKLPGVLREIFGSAEDLKVTEY